MKEKRRREKRRKDISNHLGSTCFFITYAYQIFGDFAGYSYIAIGVSKLFGISLQDNFRFPYFAKSPSEFWRNWHFSLSSWIRDYLYIPLGGNRGSRIFVYRNLLIATTLAGLWHGAAWPYVLWGLICTGQGFNHHLENAGVDGQQR